MSAPPPDPVLVAATRWLQEVRAGGWGRAWGVLRSSGAYADLTPTQYQAGRRWLSEAGLDGIHAHGMLEDSEIAEQVLQAAIEQNPPAWLADAESVIFGEEDLPLDLTGRAGALGLSAQRCLSVIRAAAAKVDTAAREAVGAWGEAEVMRLLSLAADGMAEHVAAYDDTLGYDILLRHAGTALHLEVKTTTRRGRLAFYLSRHEFRMAGADERWRLIAVLARPGAPATAIVSVSSEWLHAAAPRDLPHGGRWESARFEPPVSMLEPGISGVRIRPGAEGSEAARLIRDGIAIQAQPDWLAG